MSFQSYRHYKDSGVDWIGELPKHWRTPALSSRYSIELGKMLHESRITGRDLVPYLRNVDVQWDAINFEDLPMMDIGEMERSRYTVETGDLLVCEGGEVGRAAIVPQTPGVVGFQKAIHRLRARDDREIPRFMFYTLEWAAATGMFEVSGISTIAHLTGQQLRRYRFPTPPSEEQTTIVAFLDSEVAKIDRLVAGQQRLVALLQEKLRAIISHAVTKGLNRTTPMKNSGVEWLGSVPEHWQVKAMRNIATVVRGASPRPAGDPRYFGGDAIPWVTVSEITNDEGLYLSRTETSLTQEGAGYSRVFRKGTVIYSNSGATLGVPKILNIDACANDGVVAFEALSPTVDPEFLFYFLASLTDVIREKVKQGSGQPNLNTDIVKAQRLGVPPIDEQRQIVRQIGELTTRFALLAGDAKKAISLLQERRTSLISAAVTGKIDVRGVAGAVA